MYLRRWLRETPIFIELQVRKALARELPLKSVVMSHKKAVAISMLLTWLLSAGIVVVILMAPLWLQQHRGVSAPLVLQVNCVAIIALALGCIVAGLVIAGSGREKPLSPVAPCWPSPAGFFTTATSPIRRSCF